MIIYILREVSIIFQTASLEKKSITIIECLA